MQCANGPIHWQYFIVALAFGSWLYKQYKYFFLLLHSTLKVIELRQNMGSCLWVDFPLK